MSKKPFFIELPDNKADLVNFAFWALLAYALYTWFSIQIQVNITADTFWLAEAAERLLRGETASQSYYDPNPPLSMIFYIPPVLATATGWISLHNALFFYTLLFASGAALATYRVLRTVPGLEKTTAIAAASALIIAATVMASKSFTERDQIIGMWLVPFVLTQLALTKGWPVPAWLRHLIFFTGTFLILIKPHHGLLPTLLILHRAYTQKRISVWKDADFLYLAAGVIAYAAILLLYFSDFLYVVLPDIWQLYGHENTKFVLYRAGYYALLCVAILLFAVMVGRTSWLPYFFLWAALISLVPFVVQMRGYHYQLLPMVTFFWCGMALFGKELFQRYMSPVLALMLVTAAMTVIAFIATPSRLHAVTAMQYPELPLARALTDCPAPCPFFVINNHIEITHQTAAYTGKEWASRFPSLWFLSGLHRLQQANPAEYERLRHKYEIMLAEDLNRYKPRYVMVGRFTLQGGMDFDLFETFGQEDDFQKAWAAYRPRPDLVINQGLYFPDQRHFRNLKITYKVFERKPD